MLQAELVSCTYPILAFIAFKVAQVWGRLLGGNQPCNNIKQNYKMWRGIFESKSAMIRVEIT